MSPRSDSFRAAAVGKGISRTKLEAWGKFIPLPWAGASKAGFLPSSFEYRVWPHDHARIEEVLQRTILAHNSMYPRLLTSQLGHRTFPPCSKAMRKAPLLGALQDNDETKMCHHLTARLQSSAFQPVRTTRRKKQLQPQLSTVTMASWCV